MSFNDVANEMNAEIERQNKFNNPAKKTSNPSSSKLYPQAYFNNASGGNKGRGRGRCSFRARVSQRGNGRGRVRGGCQPHSSKRCHYCAKAVHFIKHCRLRISEEESGHINKPKGNKNDKNSLQSSQQQFLKQLSANIVSMAGQSSTKIQQPHLVEDEQPPTNPGNNYNQFPFGNPRHQARMAKFKINIAQTRIKTSSEAFIDSRATHNFFHQ